MAATESIGDTLEDLNLTNDEVERLQRAFKDTEFKKLLGEYVEEITNPENKKLYEKEITELERERGVEITFVNPEPGYVIKTSLNGDTKCFINICKNENIGKPKCTSDKQTNEKGLRWSIPYSQAPPREDIDKKATKCIVYDVVFHPETFDLSKRNWRMKELVENTAMDGVEKNFKVQLDRNNIKYPKMKFKGFPQATVIRKKIKNHPGKLHNDEYEDPRLVMPYHYPELIENDTSSNTVLPVAVPVPECESVERTKNLYTTPKYVIRYRNHIEMDEFYNSKDAKLNKTVPNELIVDIDLPLLNSSMGVDLDINHKRLKLVSNSPVKYKLDIELPYQVDDQNGNAKFDKSKKKLVITLPVTAKMFLPSLSQGCNNNGANSLIKEMTNEGNVECDSEYQMLDSPMSENNDVIENSELVPENNIYNEKASENSEKIDEDNSVTVSNKPIADMTDSFLNPSFKYTLPPFSCNVFEDVLAFTLNVKNVEPISVKKRAINSGTLHITFSSLGAGFFPYYYSFCTRLPCGFTITKEEIEIEIWDNNVIVQFRGKGSCSDSMDYYVGLTVDELEKHVLPGVPAVSKMLDEIKEEVEQESQRVLVNDNKLEDPPEVIGGVDLDVEVDNNGTTTNEIEYDKKFTAKPTSALPQTIRRRHHSSGENIESPPCTSRKKGMLTRTRSESDGEPNTKRHDIPHNFNHPLYHSDFKGILKRSSLSRSLSESSVDDWSSMENVGSISDYIRTSSLDDNEDEENRSKKSVRFNDVVRRQVYRSNSSILGQRKKNQKKSRSRRRASKRKNSETSEGEGTEGEGTDQTGSASSADEHQASDDDSDVEEEKEVIEKLGVEKINGSGDGKKVNAVKEKFPKIINGNTTEDDIFGNKVSTKLTVKQQLKHPDATNEHMTTCPIEFMNDAIFDLDL